MVVLTKEIYVNNNLVDAIIVCAYNYAPLVPYNLFKHSMHRARFAKS